MKLQTVGLMLVFGIVVGLIAFSFKEPVSFPSTAAQFGFISGYAIGCSVVLAGLSLLFAWIPGSIYWLFKRKRMPGLAILAWIIWILFALAILVPTMNKH